MHLPVPANAYGSDNIPPPASSPTIKTEAASNESPFLFSSPFSSSFFTSGSSSNFYK